MRLDISEEELIEMITKIAKEVIFQERHQHYSDEEDRGWAREAFRAKQAKLEEEMDDDELTLTITY